MSSLRQLFVVTNKAQGSKREQKRKRRKLPPSNGFWSELQPAVNVLAESQRQSIYVKGKFEKKGRDT
ncbi:hypothetical protein AAZX31_18G099300 [Glycine max]